MSSLVSFFLLWAWNQNLSRGALHSFGGPSSVKLLVFTAGIAQLVARRSPNPKVVSSILTSRISLSAGILQALHLIAIVLLPQVHAGLPNHDWRLWEWATSHDIRLDQLPLSINQYTPTSQSSISVAFVNFHDPFVVFFSGGHAHYFFRPPRCAQWFVVRPFGRLIV